MEYWILKDSGDRAVGRTADSFRLDRVAFITMRVILAFIAVKHVIAHFSFVDKRSQIACDFYATSGKNWLAQPIKEGEPYSDWWMHGQYGCQINATGSFALPANGRTYIVMSSTVNQVPPPYSDVGSEYAPSDPDFILTSDEWGTESNDPGNTLQGHHNIHAYTRNDTSGCALAISYKSNATDVQPRDFVIFSIIRDCPKRQRELIDVPNLPACPDDKCICAWLWIPKNSGTKNSFFTPFVCHVTDYLMDASPIDFTYAIPPRRCLDPILCNFGPRNPMYWLGLGEQINMPEDTSQSPHYSIRYGFRDGAQNDIFVNTNPRRNVTVQLSAEHKCSNMKSRIVEPDGWTDLTSPNCQCKAVMDFNGWINIYDGTTQISTVNIGGMSGPADLVNNVTFKANTQYFPLAVKPYRMDLNDKCYLYVTDGMGVVVWESLFHRGKALQYVESTFTGMSQDPLEWGAGGDDSFKPPINAPTIGHPTSSPIILSTDTVVVLTSSSPTVKPTFESSASPSASLVTLPTVTSSDLLTNVVRLMSQFPRFGHGSDFAKLASSEQEEQTDYVLGILAISYFIMSLFIFWTAFLIACKCMGTQRAGLCAGRMYVDCDEKGQFIKQPAYVWKIRVIFIFFGLCVLYLCIALAGPGLASIKKTSSSMRRLIFDTDELITRGLEIMDLTESAKVGIHAGMDMLSMLSIDKTFPIPEAIVRIATEFDLFQRQLQNINFKEIRKQLYFTMDGFEQIEKILIRFEENDWIIRMFALVMGVLTFFMIIQSFLAWSGGCRYLSKLRVTLEYIILPLFTVGIACCWIVTAALAFAGIINADFCFGNSLQSDPAITLTNVLLEESGIASDHMIYEAFTYYQSGCATTDPMIHLYRQEDYLQSLISEIEEAGIYKTYFRGSTVFDGIGIITDNLGILLDALRSFFEIASCSTIGTFYTQAFEELTCTISSSSFALLFLITSAISLVGMILIMLRSAMYPLQKLFPPMPLHAQEDELEEYLAYMQNCPSWMKTWNISIDSSILASRTTISEISAESTNSSIDHELGGFQNDFISDEDATSFRQGTLKINPLAPPESPLSSYIGTESPSTSSYIGTVSFINDDEEKIPFSPTESTVESIRHRIKEKPNGFEVHLRDYGGDGNDEFLPFSSPDACSTPSVVQSWSKDETRRQVLSQAIPWATAVSNFLSPSKSDNKKE